MNMIEMAQNLTRQERRLLPAVLTRRPWGG